jgi:hypothetical protein
MSYLSITSAKYWHRRPYSSIFGRPCSFSVAYFSEPSFCRLLFRMTWNGICNTRIVGLWRRGRRRIFARWVARSMIEYILLVNSNNFLGCNFISSIWKDNASANNSNSPKHYRKNCKNQQVIISFMKIVYLTFIASKVQICYFTFLN